MIESDRKYQKPKANQRRIRVFFNFVPRDFSSLSLPGESKELRAFERLLVPEYISNDILQYLIEELTCSIIFRNFSG